MQSFLSGCFLCVCYLAVCAGQEPGTVQDLASGHPVSVLLSRGHVATLRLDIAGAEAEEIFLDAGVPDISYRIISSDGAEIRSASVGTFGWTVIPFAIPNSGEGHREIQIQFRAESGADDLPGVRIRAELHPIPLNKLDVNQHAAELFNTAQPLHRSLPAENLRQAIRQFEQAAAKLAQAGDLYAEALALGGKGESEIELSRYTDAGLTLKLALDRAGENVYVRGWLLHLEARTLFDQWQGKQAKSYVDEEMRMGEEIGDPALIALARTDLVCVAFWLRDPRMGQIADQARDEAIAAGTPETLAFDLYWKGWVEEYDERDVRALSVLNDSVANFRRTGDSRNALLAVLEVAEAVNLNGDFYSALSTFKKLDPEFEASGNVMEYSANLLCIGEEYQRLNQSKLAGMYYRRADVAFAKSHILFGRMVSHRDLCEEEIQWNDGANAVRDCKLMLFFAQRFDEPAFLGEALYDIGLTERKARNLASASASFREAIKYSQTYRVTRFESKEHLQLGELLEQQSNRREALVEFERAESLSQGISDPTSLLEAQYAVALWYEQDGQFARADAELAPALEKLEAVRQLVSNNTLQVSYFAAERKCYELAVELRMRKFERDPASGDDALALEMSERSRARGLLDALSTRSTADSSERGNSDASMIRSRVAVDRAFDRRLKLLVEGGSKRDLEANSAELTQALDDLERIEDDARTAGIHAQKSVQSMTAAEIERASLGSNTSFFEYALGTEHSYLWVIGGGKRKSYILLPRKKLESMVKQWRALATSQERGEANARAEFQRLSARLSCALLADAAETGMTKMVIVPDGDLSMVPFAALPKNGCSSAPGEPLVVGHEIALTPSLSVFLSRKPAAESKMFQGEIAIVADPVFDAADSRAIALKTGTHKAGLQPEPASVIETELPRLINTGYEASAIQATVRQAAGDGQVFLAQGFDASVETVLSPVIQGYRVWHLATHGVYDESVPEFSGLVFSLLERDGNPRSGFLKARDIARLNVPAELVVLSACDSAAGENVNGEGVIGLGYAFLHAGAKQVVSTLWSVDDAQSKELMVAFYAEYFRNGRNATQALRQSQLAVMRHNSAPYYWAGFELTSVGK
jgi:CHAT domain-containing protein